MNERTESLADMLVEVISPALIMLVVGSLVCFITEVLYQGEYNFRLQFILCMFVMGTVSIARISMEEGATYASMFAAPLACVTTIALMRFVEFGGPLAPLSTVISIGLMVFIWWCAHQLTVDSTVLDRQQDSTGSGLLTQLGWGAKTETSAPPQEAKAKPEVAEAVSDHTAETAPTNVQPWWEKILAPDGRPHSHGMWAFYFSLAAVPIFGIGQFFLATEDIAARRWVFKLLVIYVASSLALLLATSFLGLRRYLKKRKLELPLEMAAGWLALGGAIIGMLLLIAFALPRPMPEYSIAQLLPEIRSPQRNSSPVAVRKEGVQDKLQGQAGTGQQQTPVENSADKSQSGGNNSGRQSGENSNNNSQSGNQSNSNDSKQGSRVKIIPPVSREKNPAANRTIQKTVTIPTRTTIRISRIRKVRILRSPRTKVLNPPANPRAKMRTRFRRRPTQTKISSGRSPIRRNSRISRIRINRIPRSPRKRNKHRRRRVHRRPIPIRHRLSRISLARSPMRSTGWACSSCLQSRPTSAGGIANKFWRRSSNCSKAGTNSSPSSLAGTRSTAGSPAALAAAPPPPPVPFSSYADPFATGEAQRWPLVRLVRHSFAALEAWGRERACVHSEQQTPAEFAQAVADQQPAVAAEVQQLAQLYGQVAYGPGVSGPVALQILQKFWLRLRTAETA